MTNRGGGARGRRAVLVGAGHAHLYTLRRASAFLRRGFDLILVAPDDFWYSGLATGVLGGAYPPALDRVDAGALVTGVGGRFVRDLVTRIDPVGQLLYLRTGPPLRYDVLSLNLGSEVPLEHLPGAGDHGISVKPIRNLWRLRHDLEGRFRAGVGRPVRVVVIGGGATGCEVAANVCHLAVVCRGPAEVTLLARGERLLEDLPARAGALAAGALAVLGVRVAFRSPAARVEDGAVVVEGGRVVPYDVLVHAWGVRPPALVGGSGLPVSESGALVVDEHLRSVADRRVHGGGDCIALAGRELPRVGVYAVRQAPVLFRNLLAALAGAAPGRFKPQRNQLLILNLGDGTGLATWGPFAWRGRLAFRLKDWLDRSFLNKYRLRR